MSQMPAATPDWGVQTGFFQRRQPAFWLFTILLFYTGLQILDEQIGMIDRVPTAWGLSWFLLALYAVPVALAIYKLDLFEREPLTLIAAALLWGGIIAVGFAGPTNTAWLQIIAKTLGPDIARAWGAALVGPPVEETLKVMGVVAIVLIARDEIDDVFDGFVYGAMIGLGFTLTEDVHYFMRFVSQAGTSAGEVGPVLHGFFIRVIASGLYGHVLYTGLSGMGIAYAVAHRELALSRRVLVAAAAFGAAIAGHFFWNSPILTNAILGGAGDPGPVQWIVYGMAKGLPFLIFVALLVRLASRRETVSFQTLVASGAGDEVATASEIQTLGGLRSRRAARKTAGGERGRQAELLVGRLQREQVGYALARSRTDRPDDPVVTARLDAIRAIRAELAALPLIPKPMPATTPATVAPGAAPWQPTLVVPAGGMAAWTAPDPTLAPTVQLEARLPLAVDEQAGDWAKVRAVNGWTGWVDRRLLVDGTLAPAPANPGPGPNPSTG